MDRPSRHRPLTLAHSSAGITRTGCLGLLGIGLCGVMAGAAGCAVGEGGV